MGHLVVCSPPVIPHIKAELSSEWLILSRANSCSGSENTWLCRDSASKSVYCSRACLSSYIHPEHKGTSSVLWEPPPHIPACTSPRAAPSHTAQRRQERQPEISVAHSWLCPAVLRAVCHVANCLSALVHPPVKQAVRTEMSRVSHGTGGCHLPQGSCTLGVLGGRDAYMLYTSAHSTHMQSISSGLRISGWLTGSRFCSRTSENCYTAQEIKMHIWKILCVEKYSEEEFYTHPTSKKV